MLLLDLPLAWRWEPPIGVAVSDAVGLAVGVTINLTVFIPVGDFVSGVVRLDVAIAVGFVVGLALCVVGRFEFLLVSLLRFWLGGWFRRTL